MEVGKVTITALSQGHTFLDAPAITAFCGRGGYYYIVMEQLKWDCGGGAKVITLIGPHHNEETSFQSRKTNIQSQSPQILLLGSRQSSNRHEPIGTSSMERTSTNTSHI